MLSLGKQPTQTTNLCYNFFRLSHSFLLPEVGLLVYVKSIKAKFGVGYWVAQSLGSPAQIWSWVLCTPSPGQQEPRAAKTVGRYG